MIKTKEERPKEPKISYHNHSHHILEKRGPDMHRINYQIFGTKTKSKADMIEQ